MSKGTVKRGLLALSLGLVLLGSERVAWAQSAASQPPAAPAEPFRSQVGFRGVVGIPSGDFADNVGVSGGIAGDFSYRLGDSPISVGAEMTVVWYGRERRQRPFSVTIPDVLVDVTTSSGILMTHARLRAQLPTGRVRPYADGLLGFNYVFTETAVDLDNDAFLERDIVRSTNLSDFAFSLGGGAGLMITVAAWESGRFSLDLNGRYVYSGEAEYLIPELLERDGLVSDLEVQRSRTDVVMLHFGGAFEF